MDARLCVTVLAVVLALSSIATCAEEPPEDVVKINELLASTQKLIDEGKLDKASVLLNDAVKRYRKLREGDRAQVDKSILQLPFDLAEAWMRTPDDDKATSRALAWYDTHWEIRLLNSPAPFLVKDGPFIFEQQKEYANILGMALTECEYDSRVLRKKYPSLARFWSPLASGDIDGDGTRDFVSADDSVAGQTTYSVFFVKGGGALLARSFVDNEKRAGFRVADEDDDGVDEILLSGKAEKKCLGVVNTGDGPELTYEWHTPVTVVEYQDGKLVKTREYDRISTREPK